MDQTLRVEFDGGSRGNPGPAGIGVVVRAADGTPLVTIGRYIGRATNNVAEYKALIAALQEAAKLGARKLSVVGDSELIVRQMTGEYKVKNADLRELWEEAQALLGTFAEVRFEHNRRHKNTLADQLVNLAMDRRAEVTEADEGSADVPAAQAPAAGERFGCPRCGCIVRIEKPTAVRPHQLRDFICQCGQRMGRIE